MSMMGADVFESEQLAKSFTNAFEYDVEYRNDNQRQQTRGG